MWISLYLKEGVISPINYNINNEPCKNLSEYFFLL